MLKVNMQTEMVQDGQKETHQFDTIGEGIEKNGSLYVKYEEEHQLENNEVVKIPVMIKITGNGTVELTRTAGHRSKLKFDQAMTTATQYQTPYGLMVLEVKTHDIEHVAESEKMTGSLNVRYQLKAEQGILGAYTMLLSYEEITK